MDKPLSKKESYVTYKDSPKGIERVVWKKEKDVAEAMKKVEKESTIILADDILVIKYSKFKEIIGEFK